VPDPPPKHHSPHFQAEPVPPHQKCHFFKQKQTRRRQNRFCLGSWSQWEGENIRKGSPRVKLVEICCTQVNGKMRPVETIPGVREGEIKKNGGGVNSIWYVVRTFANVTMYPLYSNNKNKIYLRSH
jgi:hypothetical protein